MIRASASLRWSGHQTSVTLFWAEAPSRLFVSDC